MTQAIDSFDHAEAVIGRTLSSEPTNAELAALLKAPAVVPPRPKAKKIRGRDRDKGVPPTERPTVGHDNGELVALSLSAEESYFAEEQAEADQAVATEFEVWEAVSPQLTAKQRFVLGRIDGWHDGYRYTEREVASVMGVTPAAVHKLREKASQRFWTLARDVIGNPRESA